MKVLLVSILFSLGISVNAQDTIPKIKITDLERMIAESKTPLIINFWATYCLPCLTEIPYFEEEVANYREQGVKLILVSLDTEDEYDRILPMVKKRKFSSEVIWLNESKANYFLPKIDKKWDGALPGTLFLNNAKKYRHFIGEEIPREKLVKEIKAIL